MLAAGSSLEELLGSGCTYAASEEGQRRASFVIYLLVSLLIQAGNVDFVLPLKASRIFVSKRHLVFKAGLPTELVVIEGGEKLGKGEAKVEVLKTGESSGAGRPLKKFMLRGMRERTAASVLWAESLFLLPGESASARASAASSTAVSVEKIHVWLLATLLYRMLTGRALSKDLTSKPEELYAKINSLLCTASARVR